MFSQRYSCDRCRQQKVRCFKPWEFPTASGGGDNHLTPCDRCTKADVPCVYSLRQRHRRSKGEDVPAPRRNTGLSSQDLSSVLSSRDVAAYDFNDLMIPALDTNIPCIGDGDAYSWNNDSDLSYNSNGDNMTQGSSGPSTTLSPIEGKETLAEQLMKLSHQTMGATRELECAAIAMPLTVNSPVVNGAFEAANALVRVINTIPRGASTNGAPRYPSHEEIERQLPSESSPIFLALATHQHILALFRAVCDTIKRSLGSVGQGAESQKQTLHGAGSSSAQFVMILQLLMHLLNRIGRGLRVGVGARENSDPRALTFGPEVGEESGSFPGIVDSAQVILRTIPDEHNKLSQAIQELQACIEERAQV